MPWLLPLNPSSLKILAANVAVFWHGISDTRREEWRFDIMSYSKTFYFIPNWLDWEDRKLPVIVTGNHTVGIVERLVTTQRIVRGTRLLKKAPDRMRNSLIKRWIYEPDRRCSLFLSCSLQGRNCCNHDDGFKVHTSISLSLASRGG